MSIFLKKIDNSCKLCKLNIEELLIASHIKPWKDSDNKERIDLFNGFLLCPTHDKLFDIGLISFEDSGEIIISDEIEEKNYEKLNINKGLKIEINVENKKYLKWHRENVLKK